MDITGRLIKILPEVRGESQRGPWVRGGFVIETDDTYPRQIAFTLFGEDRLAMINGLVMNAPSSLHSLRNRVSIRIVGTPICVVYALCPSRVPLLLLLLLLLPPHLLHLPHSPSRDLRSHRSPPKATTICRSRNSMLDDVRRRELRHQQ